ncbi:MAG: NAD(P)H-dependent oxidoreductase [Dehalococcoidales bacterium]|nr:MAG: NAD(P)H-dependent oxidoreductase [Dehalococcoidales bacterium]
MKLTVFNGSSRGTGSNTKILLEQFLKGFCETPGNEFEILYLNHVDKQDEFVEKFSTAEMVLLACPLYTDAMPAIVKTFIESLMPLRGRQDNPPIGFIIQSGFPEAIHSRPLERYMVKLAKRLGCPLYGTAVRGGMEGIRSMPPYMTKKVFNLYYTLGKGFGNTGRFDPDIVKKVAGRERFSNAAKITVKIMSVLKLSDILWNSLLKKNNAYERRYARPYAED